MARILVVDDDANIVELVRLYLEREGHEVRAAADGPEALARVSAEAPDLVVLDLMLPGMDGWEVCRRLREQSDVPVIMLTARGATADKVAGFGLGADDYVVKPFDPPELVARVSAVLRRARAAGRGRARGAANDSPQAAPDAVAHPAPYAAPPAAAHADADVLSLPGLTIDLAARVVRTPRGEQELPAKEFDLLVHFARHPRRVFTRDALLETVWGYEYAGSTRTVDVHVKRLRDRLHYPGAPWSIRTVWGVGYKLDV